MLLLLTASGSIPLTLQLLRERRIRHLIMEATPGFWNQSLGFAREAAARLLHDVAASGYTLQV